MRAGVLLLLAAARAAHAFTHGWGTVGDMLGMNPHAAGNGRWNDSPFAMVHWKWVAEHYQVVVLGRFEDFGADGDPRVPGNYNCSCPMESSRVQVARILKKFNPKIRLLWYQNVVGDMTCHCCNEPLRSRPEWWLWDDHGNPITHGGTCFPANASVDGNCAPYVNWTVPAAREWWYKQPLHEVCGGDAASLVDGMMMDGTMYSNPKDPQGRLPDGGNLSTARYDAVFAGKMLALEEASQMYREMNGGEMWGNPLVPATGPPHWGPRRPTDPPIDSYNRTLQHYDGGFDESFGAFGGIKDEWGECITGKPGGPPGDKINCTGDWDVFRTRTTIYAARNATIHDKKTVCFHASPGPTGVPLGSVNGTAATRPSPPHNSKAGEIVSPGWYGPEKAPWQWMKATDGYRPMDVVNATKQATADMLVQSLAPFLIMAEESSFFGYGVSVTHPCMHAWYSLTGYGVSVTPRHSAVCPCSRYLLRCNTMPIPCWAVECPPLPCLVRVGRLNAPPTLPWLPACLLTSFPHRACIVTRSHLQPRPPARSPRPP